MYFERLEIENYGPLKSLDINFPFSDTENSKPKPLVIVGKNGSGKSIFLSHLVNTLIIAKAEHYPNTEVKVGKVYKLRSPSYITSGKHYASQIRIISAISLRRRPAGIVSHFSHQRKMHNELQPADRA